MTATAGPTNPQVCMLCQTTVRNLHIELDTAHVQIAAMFQLDTTRQKTITKLQTAVRLDTVSILDLRRQLTELPKPQPAPHLFWIIKATPNQSFLAGALITILAVVSTGGKL